MVYVLIGFDEDWYTFETFLGVFSTREKAQEYADNDYEEAYEEDDDTKYYNHEGYRLFPVKIDEPFRW